MRSWVAKQTREADRELPERLRAEAGGPTDGWERLSGEEAARQRLLWNSRTHFGDWLAPSTLAAEIVRENLDDTLRVTGAQAAETAARGR